MTPEFRLVHEDDVVGKLYVVDHRGIRFHINTIPWMGEDETSWGAEVETQARSVQDVREMDPSYTPGEIRLHPTLEAALADARREIERIADEFDRGQT